MTRQEIEEYLRKTFKEVQKNFLITDLNQLTEKESLEILEKMADKISINLTM